MRVGAKCCKSHLYDLTINNNDVGVKADGTGSLTMTDVDINSVTTDVEITDGNSITFLDGVVDDTKLVFDSTSTGTLIETEPTQPC